MGSSYALGRGGQTRVLSARPRLAWLASDRRSVLSPDALSVGRASPCSLLLEAAGGLSPVLVQGAWHGVVS